MWKCGGHVHTSTNMHLVIGMLCACVVYLPSREIVKGAHHRACFSLFSASGDTASSGLRANFTVPADFHMVAVHGLTPERTSGAPVSHAIHLALQAFSLYVIRYTTAVGWPRSGLNFQVAPVHQP